MKKLTFVLCLFGINLSALSAQDLPVGFKNWLGVGTELEVNNKLTLDLSHMHCFNTSPYETQFTQLSAGIEYKLKRRTYLLAGIEQYHFRSGSDFDLFYKFYTGIQFRNTFDIPLKQAVEVEYFAPRQKKHRMRAIYTATYSPKVKGLPWKGRPFAKGMLYYYHGGAPLTYYGTDGEALAYQAPNDLHRFRLLGGFIFKPTKHWDMALFFGWNKEFNTPFWENRDLNIPSRLGTKIKYPFNNYTFLGLSFTYQLKLESNGKQKSTEKNNNRSRN